MRKPGIAYVVFYLAFTYFLSGCKLAIMVVEGGDVESDSNIYSCLEGNICVIEITDADFNETFIAVPSEGFEFSHWLSGENFLCGKSTDPRCQTDNRPLAGNAAAELLIASGVLFYITPVFVEKPQAPPPGLSPTLQAKFNGACNQCNTNGRFGAPIVHNETAWAPRLAKGMTALLASVKGGRAAMPAGGLCGDCSDDDYRSLITYMSGPAN